ncbi:MAG TPA: TIM-barrel domain-containing protein, partial [Solirubrobacterales bacterium]|nr:TIM-barrel domain-containing protein [Solirubrobacterales bacterium]
MRARTGATAVLLTASLLVIATAGPASPAAAAVKFTAKRIVVSNGKARAVIDKRQFRLVFRLRGRTVLRELRPPRSTTPAPLPSTDDPEPYTLERHPDNAVYAPLTYEVGGEVHAQWESGLWNGNTLFDRRSGTVYGARRVISAKQHGDGVRLVLATSEGGRRLVARIDPDRHGGLRVRVRPSSTAGVITVGDSFTAAPGEGFHGFGGTHGTSDKRGEKIYADVVQENLGGSETLVPGLALFPLLVSSGTSYSLAELGGVPSPTELPGGFERYLFPNGMNAAYYPQAEFVSNRGYGFLLNQTVRSRWRMANDRGDTWQVQASGSRLDYTVFPAHGPRRALRELTAVSGRHRLPPGWAEGPTLSRTVQSPALPGQPPAENPASYRAKIEQDLADIQRYGLRISAYGFEGWGMLDLAYVRSVIARLHAMGIRAILYVRAYVSDDALATQPPGDFEETERLGLVATTASGAPYEFEGNGGSPSTLLDFTKPATVAWWRQRLGLLTGLGADGFMQDFGEQVRDDMHFADGSTGVSMHNRYPVLFHRVSRQILDRWAAKHPKRGPIWFFVRAGYSGRPGSAAYEMGDFPGDETVDWGAASGLRSLAPDMLNRAVGGAFGYTTDIGGYIDSLAGPPSEELYNRWSEWATLTPYFRVHNSAASGVRMPWSYDDATLARWKTLAELHQRALPLMRRLWRKGRRTGMPVTR